MARRHIYFSVIQGIAMCPYHWGNWHLFYQIHHYRLAAEKLKLTDYLKPDSIEIGVAADSKEDLLDAVLKLADKNPHVLDAKKVRAAVLEREKIMSTGVGKNFAIPHGKTDAVDDIVLAFATTAEPVNYGSMDNEPVRIVLLLVSKESLVSQRLSLLSRASKVMNSDHARTALINAKTPEEVISIFNQEEARIGE